MSGENNCNIFSICDYLIHLYLKKAVMKYHEIKEYARKLRANPTPAEKKLWEYLRMKQLHGRKFLRQHPILHQVDYQELFYYIPDFFCYREKLIIELDGSIHDKKVEKDKLRQSILENMGYKVLRFQNHELANIDKVLKEISSQFSNEVPPLPFKERSRRLECLCGCVKKCDSRVPPLPFKERGSGGKVETKAERQKGRGM